MPHSMLENVPPGSSESTLTLMSVNGVFRKVTVAGAGASESVPWLTATCFAASST